MRVKCEKNRTIAEYYVKNGSTVRATATHFGISKSSIHKALKEFLSEYQSTELAIQLAILIQKNLKERSIRGGMATKSKYLKKKLDK